MTWLSLLALFFAYNFLWAGLWILGKNPRKAENITAALVNLCFATWNLTNAFF